MNSARRLRDKVRYDMSPRRQAVLVWTGAVLVGVFGLWLPDRLPPAARAFGYGALTVLFLLGGYAAWRNRHR